MLDELKTAYPLLSSDELNEAAFRNRKLLASLVGDGSADDQVCAALRMLLQRTALVNTFTEDKPEPSVDDFVAALLFRMGVNHVTSDLATM